MPVRRVSVKRSQRTLWRTYRGQVRVSFGIGPEMPDDEVFQECDGMSNMVFLPIF